MASGEFDVIAELRCRFPLVGDDAAVVPAPAGPLLLAADAVVEDVDFVLDPSGAGLEDAGYRAVAVNVSDVAAMGGRPFHLLVSIAAPEGVDVVRVVDGVEEAARAFGCEVAGGDLSATSGPLVVSIAITGTVADGGRPVRRSGARAGDGLFVTGPLGGAAAAWYRDRPSPRVAEGEAARLAGATSMIDVSDGLGADLGHLCDASGVGVDVDVDAVPLAAGATLAQALSGGDDYELLFTLPEGARPPAGSVRIGTIVTDRTHRPPSEGDGWQHRFS